MRNIGDISNAALCAPRTDKWIVLPFDMRRQLIQLALIDRRHLTNTDSDRLQELVLGREVAWVDTLGM